MSEHKIGNPIQRGSRRRLAGTLLLIGAVTCGVLVASSYASGSVKPKGVAKDYSYPVLAKDAAQLKGQRIVHTACIFQFDSATGTKDFLAEWTKQGFGIWDNFVDVRLPNAKVGARAFEKDVVTMRGYILGNLTYTTTAGGKNTVPEIEATSVVVKGHNCS